MDAAILYAIVTLANGEMKTRVVPMRPADQCEQIANLPHNRVLAWCRRQKIIVIAH